MPTFKGLKYFYKILILTIMFLIPLFTLTGCFNKQSSNQKTIEVEFWTLQLSNFAPYINSIIAEYETLHPNVKIKWIDVPFSEGEKRALAAIMSNRVPDLINMNPNFGSTLASRNALVNIKHYITEQDYDKYLPESWDTSSITTDKPEQNIIFGIPWYITSSINIYNAQIIKEAGLNSDNPPKTYEELGIDAKIIKEKTGKYAFMPNLTEDGKLLQFFAKYDVPIVNKEKTKALFNTPKAVEILTFWTKMYKKGLIPPESLTQGHRASLERYQAGEDAIILTGANFLNIIKDNAPKVYKQTRVAPQIVGSNKKVDFALMNLVVPKKSKHIKEAVDFGLFVTNTKNQLKFCKLAPILPSTKEGINSDFFKEKPDADLMAKARSISARQLNNALKPIPTLDNQKDLFEYVDNATQEALLGEKTPAEALNIAVKEWDKLLKN